MNLMELMISVAVDSKTAINDLGKIQTNAQKMGAGIKKAAKVGAVAIGAVTAATTALSAAVMKNVGATAEYGDNIDKMSQKIGISATAYQEWGFIMEHCGANVDSLQGGMKKLASAAESGSDAFTKLGISQEEVASLSQEDLFGRVIEGLQGMEAGAERTNIATDLLGKSATELGPLLNASADDVEAMKQQVHDLGGVMSDEAVKAAAAFEDSLTNLKTAFIGAKNNAMSEFMPAMTEIMDGITAAFTGDDSGFALIEKGVGDFLSNLGNLVTDALPAFGAIVSAFADFATQAISKFANYISTSEGQTEVQEAVASFADWIGQNIGPFIEAGAQLGWALVTGLSRFLIMKVQDSVANTLAETGLWSVEQVQDAMDAGWKAYDTTDGVGAINAAMDAYGDTLKSTAKRNIRTYNNTLEGGKDDTRRAAETLADAANKGANATDKLGKTGTEGIAAYVASLDNGKSDVGSKAEEIADETAKMQPPSATTDMWGRDLVTSFANGMTSNKSAVTNASSGLAGIIRSFLHFSEPDEGPLSDFHTYAPDMVELFAKGIKENKDKAKDAAWELASAVNEVFSSVSSSNSVMKNIFKGKYNLYASDYDNNNTDAMELKLQISEWQALAAEQEKIVSALKETASGSEDEGALAELEAEQQLYSSINDTLKTLKERLDAVNDASAVDKLTEKLSWLTQEQETQKNTWDAAEEAYKRILEQYGEGSEEAKDMREKLLDEKQAYSDITGEIQETTQALKEYNQQMQIANSYGGSISSRISYAQSAIGKINNSVTGVNSGNITLNVTSQIDGKVLAQSTYDYNLAESNRRGASLVSVGR